MKNFDTDNRQTKPPLKGLQSVFCIVVVVLALGMLNSCDLLGFNRNIPDAVYTITKAVVHSGSDLIALYYQLGDGSSTVYLDEACTQGLPLISFFSITGKTIIGTSNGTQLGNPVNFIVTPIFDSIADAGITLTVTNTQWFYVQGNIGLGKLGAVAHAHFVPGTKLITFQ